MYIVLKLIKIEDTYRLSRSMTVATVELENKKTSIFHPALLPIYQNYEDAVRDFPHEIIHQLHEE